jgi:hypothetical protein
MRLRFTISDLLWLTAVVAMGLGWWLDHPRLTPYPDTDPAILESVPYWSSFRNRPDSHQKPIVPASTF